MTSRQTDIADETRRYVAEHFPGVFADVHFGNHFGRTTTTATAASGSGASGSGGGGKAVSKPEMCARIGAVALIDDSLDYAAQIAAAPGTMRAILFGDYPWNRAPRGHAAGAPPPPLPARVERARGWPETVQAALRLLKELEQQEE